MKKLAYAVQALLSLGTFLILGIMFWFMFSNLYDFVTGITLQGTLIFIGFISTLIVVGLGIKMIAEWSESVLHPKK